MKSCKTCNAYKKCPVPMFNKDHDKNIESCWHDKARKYRNKKVTYNGVEYDSKKEVDESLYLRATFPYAKIEYHRSWDLLAHGIAGPVIIGTFTPDFVVYNDGDTFIHEVKSPVTRTKADYRLRVKIFKANYPAIQFFEILYDKYGRHSKAL